MFGLLRNLAAATVKTALLPLDVVADTVRVIDGQEPKQTVKRALEVTEHVIDGVTDPLGLDT